MKIKKDEILVLVLVTAWSIHYVVIPLFKYFFQSGKKNEKKLDFLFWMWDNTLE